jgi:RHS repeat-associated protein
MTYAGPNSDGDNRYFVYDAAVVNGAPMVGAKSRIAEAYTALTAGGTKVTDEGFSYTARGEVSDVYQFSTHSGGYYHTSATYFENGSLKVLSGVPGTTAWTFSIDGKGRPYSAIQGTSTSIVNSVSYNASNQPLVISLGLGDSDNYTYDPNTGRMSSYTFTIGSTPASQVGNLTWNANGTLRQLAITDGVNAGGTQTCNYGTSSTPGYDELGRLVSVDCGATTWQQTFSYDGFNNLTKTVPTGGTGAAWMPGYNLANNNELGSTYDSNGNLLTDTFHTYTWDQNNKVKSLADAGITLTYDAFGNMVEKNTSGVYTQMLYSPIGRVATMSGQTVTQWLLPAPGGVKAATGIQFWHADWLGTVRFASGKNGRNVVSDKAYAPYGEVYKAVVGGSVANSFTGDLQDIVAGTFDTPNRELNPNQGRWISPDPAHSGWNAYAYTTNPLSATDWSGLGAEDYYTDYGSSATNECGWVITFPSADGLDHYINLGNPMDDLVAMDVTGNVSASEGTSGSGSATEWSSVNVAHDTIVGGAKGLWNNYPALAINVANNVTNAVISPFTNFRFPLAQEFTGSTPDEKSAMAGVFLGSLLTGTGEARTAGMVGETAAGIIKNTERIESLSKTAAYRIPDELNHAAQLIGEVKNTSYQAYTRQLQDFAAYSQKYGYKFNLYVREGTKLSAPLQKAVNDGFIVLMRSLP